MRLFRGLRRAGRTDRSDPLRFEYCCGAECNDECRRAARNEEILRMSPRLGLRVG